MTRTPIVAADWGIWTERRWAAGARILLGVVIAATWLVEGFAFGLEVYLRALAVAVLAVLPAITAAVYVRRHSQQHRFHRHMSHYTPAAPSDSAGLVIRTRNGGFPSQTYAHPHLRHT